jgi:hypothetical protein
MTFGCTALALHYLTTMQKFMFCPVPLLYGPSGTGKTTVFHCALSFLGFGDSRFYYKATMQKYIDLCYNSFMPLGIDGAQSLSAISELVIALFNGEKGATMKRGTR